MPPFSFLSNINISWDVNGVQMSKMLSCNSWLPLQGQGLCPSYVIFTPLSGLTFEKGHRWFKKKIKKSKHLSSYALSRTSSIHVPLSAFFLMMQIFDFFGKFLPCKFQCSGAFRENEECLFCLGSICFSAVYGQGPQRWYKYYDHVLTDRHTATVLPSNKE